MWGALLGGILSAVGAIGGSVIQANQARHSAQQVSAWDRESQATQIQFAREDREWEYAHNLAMQEQAQSFQANMSNTAHQREMADMKAAGINPILSATGGNGASTPSGQGGDGGDSDLSNAYSNIVNANAARKNAETAAAEQKMNARLGIANAVMNGIGTVTKGLQETNNAKLLEAQTRLSEHQMRVLDSTALMNESVAGLNAIQTALKQSTFGSDVYKSLQEARGVALDNLFKQQSTANLKATIDNIKAQTELYNSQGGYYERMPVLNNSFGLNTKLGGFNINSNRAYNQKKNYHYETEYTKYGKPYRVKVMDWN